MVLIKLRMRSIRQSGNVVNKRAEAQSTKIDVLIAQLQAKESKKIAEAAKNDSYAMKKIAMVTIVFLPGTYFAALFAMPTLKWDQPNTITSRFWIYWIFTLPVTFIVFILLDLQNERVFYPWLKDKFDILFLQREQRVRQRVRRQHLDRSSNV
ncbi:hypothetical protein F4821DRAFT_233218 [Hypoxylon rubiginosum]|uniref:Uncharacterized protein n=1 Tax=Hypoxylon rubiginosum TaxID=110542 RepID=A0ACC0D7B3_9PEZI|nr:hypothetical protein F4821DRAFT_233218 [Hypoxylon rubiginosum]